MAFAVSVVLLFSFLNKMVRYSSAYAGLWRAIQHVMARVNLILTGFL